MLITNSSCKWLDFCRISYCKPRIWKRHTLKYFKKKLIFFIVCSSHVTYAFQSESKLYSCLNVKKLLARNRREIWSLSDYNWTRTQNHLVRKRTLNHLVKLAKWLSCVCMYMYVLYIYIYLICIHIYLKRIYVFI